MLDNREIHIIILVVVLVIICYMSRKEKFEIEHTRTSNSTIKHGEKYLGIIGNKLGLDDSVVYFNLSSDLKKGNKNIFYNLQLVFKVRSSLPLRFYAVKRMLDWKTNNNSDYTKHACV